MSVFRSFFLGFIMILFSQTSANANNYKKLFCSDVVHSLIHVGGGQCMSKEYATIVTEARERILAELKKMSEQIQKLEREKNALETKLSNSKNSHIFFSSKYEFCEKSLKKSHEDVKNLKSQIQNLNKKLENPKSRVK
jgi:predicted RNase H-like nuclease (RuvC/YqgF family)